jgi:hypothetical protein
MRAKPEKPPVSNDREDTGSSTSIESKQREKYETNEINENIRGGFGLRRIGGDNVRAADHNDNND